MTQFQISDRYLFAYSRSHGEQDTMHCCDILRLLARSTLDLLTVRCFSGQGSPDQRAQAQLVRGGLITITIR